MVIINKKDIPFQKYRERERQSKKKLFKKLKIKIK
jgi:hypothetical protein